VAIGQYDIGVRKGEKDERTEESRGS